MTSTVWDLLPKTKDFTRLSNLRSASPLMSINSLMRMSRQWENHKDSSPAMDINLGHQAFQKIRQLRRMNLLPIAQMLLHRYYDRQEQLITRFGKLEVSN